MSTSQRKGMHPPVGIICYMVLVITGLSGCASSQPYTAPGIQPEDAAVLSRSYYWRRGVDPERFTDEQIQALFARALGVGDSDGEVSELYTSQLIWALAAAGDRHFADLLSIQPRDIQLGVLRHMDSLWTYEKMHYPLTEALGVPRQPATSQPQ